MTEKEDDKYEDLPRAASSDGGSTVDLSSPPKIPSPPPQDIAAKHQLITANDVRHFVLPHLPLNGSDSCPPYFSSILADQDGNMKREINDYRHIPSGGYEMTVVDPPVQPKCCFIGVVTASIGSVLATVLATILFAVYLFMALRGQGPPEASVTNLGLIGTLLAVCAILVLFSAAFIYGTVKGRKRWLLPLVLLCVCICVATIGTFAAISITAIDDIEEAVSKSDDHRTLLIVNVVAFRLAFVVFIVLQVIVIVCYIRCYRYISNSNDN